MAPLHEITAWLHQRFQPEAQHTLYRDGPSEVAVLALALEPNDVPTTAQFDALFLHRPFSATNAFTPAAILTSHDGFDHHLTTGPNHALAHHLHWTNITELNWEGRTAGLLASAPQHDWPALVDALAEAFGGYDEIHAPTTPLTTSEPLRVALLNAMRPPLLNAVHELGTHVYITGQFRPGARHRAHELDLPIIALGHRRSELWGLQQLKRELHTAFPSLQLDLYPS